jgi:hypothetical protein
MNFSQKISETTEQTAPRPPPGRKRRESAKLQGRSRHPIERTGNQLRLPFFQQITCSRDQIINKTFNASGRVKSDQNLVTLATKQILAMQNWDAQTLTRML